MTEFKIQETTAIKSFGIRCHMCGKFIDKKEGIYRIKYGNYIYHLGCFYKWLNSYLLFHERKDKDLKICYEELKKYMPQILAENIINKDT